MPHLLDLDPRGLEHLRNVLATYLPGLDPGVFPLKPRRALVPDTTLQALQAEYGTPGTQGILELAGVNNRQHLSESAALKHVRGRDAAALPYRAPQAIATLQWHLDALNVAGAWSQVNGPNAINWGGIKVGQIDTGYTAHPVFGFPTPWLDTASARTIFAPSRSNEPPGPGGGIDPLIRQMDGHGTRVGSVICGYDDTAAGEPFYGVAPKVPLVPVRIANSVLINHAQKELAEALMYLVDDVGVSVINLSMGFLPRVVDKQLKRAMNHTYECGVIFVCAAGQPLSSVVSPAHSRRTVAVAGSRRGDIPWGQSAHGPSVDWSAPADDIYRAEPNAANAPQYRGSGDGTSYAAAATTGAAALWLAKHGAAITAKYPLGWQRVEAFLEIAKTTARPMPNQQPGSFGAGVLDIGQLLQTPLPPAAVTQQAPA